MISLDTLRAEVARGMCNTDPDPMWNCGAACRLEAEPKVGPCEHLAAASAAIAIVLRAVAKDLTECSWGMDHIEASFPLTKAKELEDAALAAGGGR